MNDLRNMQVSIEAVKKAGKHGRRGHQLHHQPGARHPLFRADGQGPGSHGLRHPGHQGHGRPAHPLHHRGTGEGAENRRGHADPPPQPRHLRPVGHVLPEGRGSRRHHPGYLQLRLRRRRQPLLHREHRRRPGGYRVRHRPVPAPVAGNHRLLPRGAQEILAVRKRLHRHGYPGAGQPGARRHDLQPVQPAQGTGRPGPHGRSAVGNSRVCARTSASRRWSRPPRRSSAPRRCSTCSPASATSRSPTR